MHFQNNAHYPPRHINNALMHPPFRGVLVHYGLHYRLCLKGEKSFINYLPVGFIQNNRIRF
jgi:hypothetical protein